MRPQSTAVPGQWEPHVQDSGNAGVLDPSHALPCQVDLDESSRLPGPNFEPREYTGGGARRNRKRMVFR